LESHAAKIRQALGASIAVWAEPLALTPYLDFYSQYLVAVSRRGISSPYLVAV
jgi:hypothetical protein